MAKDTLSTVAGNRRSDPKWYARVLKTAQVTRAVVGGPDPFFQDFPETSCADDSLANVLNSIDRPSPRKRGKKTCALDPS